MHYVGYVEEDETPEQIMAKFAQLEKIQGEMAEAKAAAKAAAKAGVGFAKVVNAAEHTWLGRRL